MPELIHGLSPGEEIVITENDRPVAKLTTAAPQLRKPPMLGTQPGTLPGTVLYMSPDFDAPLDDFKEYME